MARIEDEIGKIADPVLRATLFDEVKKLKTEKRFGLVFEEHLPELVPVFGARVKARSLVARRGRTFRETFKVVRVYEGVAEVEKNDGSRESLLVDELTVVRRFGEPIYPALRPFDRVRNGDTSQPHENFGRIELIRVVGGNIKRLDLNDDETRRKVLMVDTNAGLDVIFDGVS